MKNTLYDNNHFVVSYELLQLLEWMMYHEQDALKKIISRSFEQGFVPYSVHKKQDDVDEARQWVMDFFGLLEVLMVEVTHEQETKEVTTRSVLPAVDHIDSRLYDSRSLAASIAKANLAAENNTGENPKEILCKELLKRWKPTKKAILN